jgi:hypothetical protein
MNSTAGLYPRVSKTKIRQLKALIKERMSEKRSGKDLGTPEPPPRYDEVFALGQAWLDSLAGDPITSERGQIHFPDAIWKSAGRREPEIP